ncbi:hypothetical protein [Stenotrophomonas phage RAS14]
MKRITNLQTGKNAEYIQRQWIHVGAIRDRLISATEWTQNGDNLLTLESYILWSDWRRKVYDVSEATYSSPEEAEAALNVLNDSKPLTVNTSTVMRQKKYRLDLSSIDAAKRDGKRIVREFLNDYIENSLPESINIINLKYQSYLLWKDSGMDHFLHFPILQTHKEMEDLDINETIDDILSTYKTATELVANQIKISKQIECEIEDAPNLKTIIAIVKKMHGY